MCVYAVAVVDGGVVADVEVAALFHRQVKYFLSFKNLP